MHVVMYCRSHVSLAEPDIEQKNGEKTIGVLVSWHLKGDIVEDGDWYIEKDQSFEPLSIVRFQKAHVVIVISVLRLVYASWIAATMIHPKP